MRARHCSLLLLALAAGAAARPCAGAPAPNATPQPARSSVAAAFDRYASTFLPASGAAQAFDLAGSDLALRFERGGTRMLAGAAAARVRFDGAGSNAAPRPIDPVEGATSYFTGPRGRWRTGVSRYAGIRYDDVWPGVDVLYRAEPGRVKYELTVDPGADAGCVALRYSGTDRVRVDDTGRLVVSLGGREVVDEAPYAYQVSAAGPRKVACRYAVAADPRDGSFVVTFALGAYDRASSLVIDPAMVVSSGFIGGSQEEGVGAVATDADGNVYVAGATASSESDGFPAAAGFDSTFDPSGLCAADPQRRNIYQSIVDVFVAKVKADGSALEWCTYLGGKCNQVASGVAVDKNGNVFVTGSTNSTEATFPVTVGPSLTNKGGLIPGDGFVAKLSPDGKQLLYCGFIGGEGEDQPNAIAVDASGAAYVGGLTSSKQTFPVTVGPQLTTPDTSTYDGFVAKVKPDGSGLAYCGYVAGKSIDFVTGIAVDPAGAAYVSGQSSSPSSLPVTVGPSLTYGGGVSDAFVGKVKPDGSGFAYLGWIGGASVETAGAVAVDSGGSAYVAGDTRSNETTFPVRGGPDLTFNSLPATKADAFVAKVKPDGSGLVYCGYIGGDRGEGASAIAVDGSGRAVVVGATYSTEASFPVSGGPDVTFNGTNTFSDAFVAVVKADGSSLESCGYLGGDADDQATAVAFAPNGNIVVAGVTQSAQFPVAGAFGATFKGSADAFVTIVSTGPPGPSISTVSKVGTKLVVTGANFKSGAAVLVNGTAYKAKPNPAGSTTTLKSGKAGKVIKAGDSVQVRNPDGRLSNAVTFSG